MSQAALHCSSTVTWRTLVSGIAQTPEPSVKLH
jgi:hypothetical protein